MKKEQVRQLVECMVIVSQADGLHEEEVKFMTSILLPLWKEESTSLDEFVNAVIQENLPASRFIQSARALAKGVDQHEKQVVLNLMQKLMLADGIFTHQEKEYYVEFQKLFK
ncbi:hypothetical protein WDW89_04215 [Deltaproteobacteria bacterium TL4]